MTQYMTVLCISSNVTVMYHVFNTMDGATQGADPG